MRIAIQGVPEFVWSPTKEHLAVLTKLSSHHYDGVCKSASRVGGFIYGWSNCIACHEEGDDEPRCYGKFREFDTCLKIMEWSQMLCDDAEMLLVHEMRKGFYAALRRGNQLYETWTGEVTI